MRVTLSRAYEAGGCLSARRLFVAFAVMTGGLTQPLLAMPQGPSPDVSLHVERGVYSVTARFQVPQPAALVLAVLTDYETIPRFMPDIHTSVVLERADGQAIVQQEAVSRVMLLLSKRVHLVLEIDEGEDTLRFNDRCGQSFARYQGLWRVSDQNGRAEVLYQLVAQPSFDVPEFVLKRVLKRNAEQMIEQLQREIAARSGR